MKFLRMDLTWLNSVEVTRYKAVITVWLCIGTFAVWAVCALAGVSIEEISFGMWLAFLAGLAGFNYAQYKSMRTTDYGYVERKGAANVPAQVTTVEAGAQVNVAGATTTEIK